MTHDELAKIVQRYIKFSLVQIFIQADRHEERQEYLHERYFELFSDCVRLDADDYTGHLIRLFQIGYKMGRPVENILEEMEKYRGSFVKALIKDDQMRHSLIFNELVFKKGEKAKLKMLIEYIGKYNMLPGLRKFILLEYPNSQLPDLAHIKSKSDELNGREIIQRRTGYPEDMTAQEAAEYLNTTVDQLYNLTSKRKIPHHKRGRKLVFKYSELKTWNLAKVATEQEIKSVAASHVFLKHKKK